MVKWGFDYGYINDMPLDEYYEYLEMIEKHFEEEKESIRRAKMGNMTADDASKEPRPIGMVAPRKT